MLEAFRINQATDVFQSGKTRNERANKKKEREKARAVSIVQGEGPK
jgi:hypothetical protein